MTSYHEFLQACQVIGGVCGSNGRYQEALFRRIEKHWRAMTIRQLLEAIEQESIEFNRLEAIARGEE